MANLILNNSRFNVNRLVVDFAPSVGQVRWSSKPYIRKFKQPHFDKKLILAASEPIKAIDRRSTWEKCTLYKVDEAMNRPIHPYEEILAREFQDLMMSSRFVAVYQENSITSEDKRLTKNMLQKKNYTIKHFNRNVYKAGLKDTKYSSIMSTFLEFNKTVIVACPEPEVAQLLAMDKKMFQYVLLFGIVDGQVLRKDQLIEYSQLASLDAMRSSLCFTLESAARSVSDNINHHLVSLSSNLEQLSQGKTNKEE
ncbi:39S ribosomal protein L10, mitochondrial [Halotydeus destructor]|nr:39S ribosomal protein L10, mitochondrial [Halotydeus destructor]